MNIASPPSRMKPAAPAGNDRPTREEAEAAVRTLLRWACDDPTREGLLDTPARVVRSYEELYSGYHIDPVALLERTFDETEGYDEIVLLRDIRLESVCEHHMVPIIGRAHVAYLPHRRVVGISKLARVVDAYSKRLQIQEKLTAQIANTINEVLQPRGVAVIIEATHQCMTTPQQPPRLKNPCSGPSAPNRHSVSARVRSGRRSREASAWPMAAWDR